MIWIFLLNHFQETLTGQDVDPPSVGIVEQVVRFTCDLNGGNLLARVGIEREQARRLPASDEEPMMRLVERHGEVISCRGYGPPAKHGALGKIDDLDLFLVWNVHEKA